VNVINFHFYSSTGVVLFPLLVHEDPAPPVVFNVDHPFLSLLVDDYDKIPLFASRVSDPTAS
jgi:serine protease inhibitor